LGDLTTWLKYSFLLNGEQVICKPRGYFDRVCILIPAIPGCCPESAGSAVTILHTVGKFRLIFCDSLAIIPKIGMGVVDFVIGD